jgi:replicative DNA helicase
LLKLNRAWSATNTRATPLPQVWTDFNSKQIKFRRGQVCMVAAAPNAGKSMFALVYAIRAKVPTLFFSADTDTATVTIRVAAALAGHNQQTVERNLDTNTKYYDKYLEGQSHIQWVFDSSPSLDDIELEVKAYVELYGITPELIVIDNLMNVVAEHDNEWAGLRQIMMELHDMARKTEACVMVLHHVSEQGEYGDTTTPPARRAIHGKVSQLPSLILTLGYSPTEGTLRVAPVKNRFGPMYANANEHVALAVDYATCRIENFDATGRMVRNANPLVRY